MTQEEIKKRNEAIAVFMGFKIHNHASYRTFEIDGRHIYESVLQYNTLWDRLMLAVEKIEKTHTTKIEFLDNNHSCAIWEDKEDNPIIRYTGTTNKINIVFKAVSDFCIKYNETNK